LPSKKQKTDKPAENNNVKVKTEKEDPDAERQGIYHIPASDTINLKKYVFAQPAFNRELVEAKLKNRKDKRKNERKRRQWFCSRSRGLALMEIARKGKNEGVPWINVKNKNK